NKYARRIEITLGLLCSKSFGYDGLRRVVTEDYGVPLEDVAKVNIKGRFQLWRRSTGELVEIPLKQLAQATREGCKLCPDFAAEHADIATGGLGQRDGWTLAVVRTARGEEWLPPARAGPGRRPPGAGRGSARPRRPGSSPSARARRTRPRSP